MIKSEKNELLVCGRERNCGDAEEFCEDTNRRVREIGVQCKEIANELKKEIPLF